MHVNIFDTKTDEELILLYNQFLEAEKNGAFPDNTELAKIKREYEKDFGATLLPTFRSSAPRYLIADDAAKQIFLTYLSE